MECPACRLENPPGSDNCDCGYGFTGFTKAGVVAVRSCPFCKERVQSGAIKCPHCREPLGGFQNGARIVQGVLVLGALLVILYVIAVAMKAG